MILKVAIIEAGALVPDINKTCDRMLQSNCGQFYEKTVRAKKGENEKEIKCVLSLRIVLIYDVGQVSDQ